MRWLFVDALVGWRMDGWWWTSLNSNFGIFGELIVFDKGIWKEINWEFRRNQMIPKNVASELWEPLWVSIAIDHRSNLMNLFWFRSFIFSIWNHCKRFNSISIRCDAKHDSLWRSVCVSATVSKSISNLNAMRASVKRRWIIYDNEFCFVERKTTEQHAGYQCLGWMFIFIVRLRLHWRRLRLLLQPCVFTWFFCLVGFRLANRPTVARDMNSMTCGDLCVIWYEIDRFPVADGWESVRAGVLRHRLVLVWSYEPGRSMKFSRRWFWSVENICWNRVGLMR